MCAVWQSTIVFFYKIRGVSFDNSCLVFPIRLHGNHDFRFAHKSIKSGVADKSYPRQIYPRVWFSIKKIAELCSGYGSTVWHTKSLTNYIQGVVWHKQSQPIFSQGKVWWVGYGWTVTLDHALRFWILCLDRNLILILVGTGKPCTSSTWISSPFLEQNEVESKEGHSCVWVDRGAYWV